MSRRAGVRHKARLALARRQMRRALQQTRIRRFTIIAVFAITLIAAAVTVAVNAGRDRVYRVAYVGRDQRPQFDALHVMALKRYLAELNAELHEERLELDVFSNGGRADESRRVYGQITRDKRYVAVLDNTWGSELKEAAAVIRDSRIPVIALNGDYDAAHSGGNVLFLGHDNYVPRRIADFATKVVGAKELIFICEETFPLTAIFDKELAAAAVTVTRYSVRGAISTAGEEARLFGGIDRDLALRRQEGKSPVVVINTHARWGARIIDHVNRTSTATTMIGGPYITDSAHGEVGTNGNGNRLILLTNPSDAMTEKVYTDLVAMRRIDATLADIKNSQLFVKRCLDAVAMLRGAMTDEQRQARRGRMSRDEFLRFFNARARNNEFIGRHDLYAFDDHLLVLDEKTFEQHSYGEAASYPLQVNTQRDVIPNLYFGIEVIDISNVDPENRSFHADFLYWLKYDASERDMEKNIHFRNAKNQELAQETALEIREGGIQYKLYKKSADFSIDADFRRFPFDVQELKIELALIVPSDRVLISFDHEGFAESRKRASEFSLADWQLRDFYVTVDNIVSTSSRGGTGLMTRKPRKFKTLTVRMPVRRQLTGPFVTIILPLLMIGLSALAMLYLVDSAAEVSAAIFLSIVTYSIGFAELTPRSNQLTTADLLFYLTFFVTLGVFMKVILLNSTFFRESVRSRIKRNAHRIAFGAYVVYGMLVLAILAAGSMR